MRHKGCPSTSDIRQKLGIKQRSERLPSLAHYICRGDFIRILRKHAPSWLRKITPEWFKVLLRDFQWKSYQFECRYLRREVRRPTHPILVISIPKCGTYLLRNILLGLPGTRFRKHIWIHPTLIDSPLALAQCKKDLSNFKKGEVRLCHIPFHPDLGMWLDKQGIKRIFIYRDPRDYAVSHYHFIMDLIPRHPYYEIFKHCQTNGERLMACIRGIGEGQRAGTLSESSFPNVDILYRRFLGWRNAPHTFSLRYEDLIQKADKDSIPKTKELFASLFSYLGILKNRLSDEALIELLKVARNPKNAHTFRRGLEGSWRSEYTKSHITAFKEIANNLLLELGYERDADWK